VTTRIRCVSRFGRLRLFLIAVLSLLVTSFSLHDSAAQEAPGAVLKMGSNIPELSGVDQFGKQQNFDSLKGPNGLVLLFFRSADW
jgi:hypothetical protein